MILCVAPSLDHRIHLIYASVTAKGSSTCFAWPRPVTQRIHLFFSLIAVSNLAIYPSSLTAIAYSHEPRRSTLSSFLAVTATDARTYEYPLRTGARCCLQSLPRRS